MESGDSGLADLDYTVAGGEHQRLQPRVRAQLEARHVVFGDHYLERLSRPSASRIARFIPSRVSTLSKRRGS